MKRLREHTILLTGFEPFGGATTNPSADLARALDGRLVAGHRIVGAVLPCVFAKAGRALSSLRRRHRPRAIVCLGLAESRAEITPERVAINVADARIPDNAGAQPIDRPIVRGGPAAYWSTLPVKKIVAALRAEGLPASVSNSAGTFVCNHVFYGLMHALAHDPFPGEPSARGGFIHVPPLATSVHAKRNKGSLSLERLRRAVEIALGCVAAESAAASTPAGSVGTVRAGRTLRLRRLTPGR